MGSFDRFFSRGTRPQMIAKLIALSALMYVALLLFLGLVFDRWPWIQMFLYLTLAGLIGFFSARRRARRPPV